MTNTHTTHTLTINSHVGPDPKTFIRPGFIGTIRAEGPHYSPGSPAEHVFKGSLIDHLVVAYSIAYSAATAAIPYLKITILSHPVRGHTYTIGSYPPGSPNASQKPEETLLKVELRPEPYKLILAPKEFLPPFQDTNLMTWAAKDCQLNNHQA